MAAWSSEEAVRTVLLLWFYISGLAILAGAEMNGEIERASPWAKDPGEKVPGRKKIGAAASRAYEERMKGGSHRPSTPVVQPRPAAAAFQRQSSGGSRTVGVIVGVPLLATRLWTRFKRRRETRA